MPTSIDLEPLGGSGCLSAATSTLPHARRASANGSFLNLGGLAGAAAGAAGALGGPLGGAVGGVLGGMAGVGQSKLIPEPKAEGPRDRFKLLLEVKRTGYPDDHSPQPDAGSPGQLGFAALHWSRHEVANALRAMESMRFVEQQAQVAKGIADKAAAQLTYLMESPCLRGVTQPAEAARLPDQQSESLTTQSAPNATMSMCPIVLQVLTCGRTCTRDRQKCFEFL
ncbi:unnamed protein product [Symbiodinium natans]|uniref:Uncharacterized protein n=1 Tax=Symbiodinium natans TaxID=878477 RepID=A0A812UDE5_9DINO|nr:unnamed protein product [Symbiodinium natans]